MRAFRGLGMGNPFPCGSAVVLYFANCQEGCQYVGVLVSVAVSAVGRLGFWRQNMPCYTEWNAYLDKGSQEYKTKEAELNAKLKSVKHILDYYYGVRRLRVPPATHSGEQAWLEMAHQQFEVEKTELHGVDEEHIIKNIAHHISCDGIHFTLIYDLVSLLDIQNTNEAGYARVMMTCANEIRANKHQYEPISW